MRFFSRGKGKNHKIIPLTPAKPPPLVLPRRTFTKRPSRFDRQPQSEDRPFMPKVSKEEFVNTFINAANYVRRKSESVGMKIDAFWGGYCHSGKVTNDPKLIRAITDVGDYAERQAKYIGCTVTEFMEGVDDMIEELKDMARRGDVE